MNLFVELHESKKKNFCIFFIFYYDRGKVIVYENEWIALLRKYY